MKGPRAEIRDVFSVDDLPYEQMRGLYAYWLERRDGEDMPPDTAIDPLRLPQSCLPFIAIDEVSYGPLRFRARLCGTGVAEAVGVDHTGRYVDEIDGMAEQLQRLAWCVQHRRPYTIRDRMTFSPRDYRSYSALALPFAGRDGAVTRIVICYGFSKEPLVDGV
jgi:hypothetical protein